MKAVKCMSLADKLQELRESRNWSQQTLADMMKISRSTISRYETGKSVPNYETVIRYAELFRIDKQYLVNELDQLLPKTGYIIEENLTDPDLAIINELFQDEPDLKKALIDLRLLPPKRRAFLTNLIVYTIKAGKNSKHNF
jgi:transcriptional regulator with XRE-family HTH domain